MSAGKLKIKVCGMREPGNIADVARLLPDFMGFIFFPESKRFVGNTPAVDISSLPASVLPVGVFVKEPIADVIATAHQYKLAGVQLHGGESAEDCRLAKAAGLKVFKVFSVAGDFNFDVLSAYESAVDYFLFDTAGPGYGGTGHAFDHTLLSEYPSATPYLLSGGLHLEVIKNICADMKHFPGLAGFDLNSKYELAPGLKNIELLQQTFDFLRYK